MWGVSDLVEQKDHKQKLFYGWVITGLVSLNLAMAYGAQYSFGVLFPSMIEEFKWNRQSLSGAFSLYAFLYSALGVILGRWTDRFGPRIILILGSAFLGVGIGLISQVNSPWQLYVVYGLLASWGMSATYITANPIIVKWFIAQRGLALGVAQSGLGIGIIIIPPITGALITALGWRPTCVVLGMAVFIVLCTTSFFLIGHPEKVGLLPDGRQKNLRGQSSSTAHPEPIYGAIYQEVNWSVAEAVHTKSFWILTALFFCTWLFVFLPLVHLVIFAMDIGLSRESALIALSILGGSSTLGRLIMGTISDRIGRKKALTVTLCLQVFSWFWIMGTTTGWMLLIFSALFGFSYGGVSAVFPAIIGDYFGRLKAASVLGTIFTLAGSAAAIGPLVAGSIHDQTHSYQLAYLCGALTNLLALTLLAFSQPPVRKVRS